MENNMLQHYGVLGMKWGVRRNRKQQVKRAVKYKKADREVDQAMYGKRGVKRIEARMKKGNSHTLASTKEMGRLAVKSMLGATATGVVVTDVMTRGAVHKVAACSYKNYIRKYATSKAQQRANASLSRIGQFTYKHVAGNVYKKVMV